jgi:hypothetical protein
MGWQAHDGRGSIRPSERLARRFILNGRRRLQRAQRPLARSATELYDRPGRTIRRARGAADHEFQLSPCKLAPEARNHPPQGGKDAT